MADDDNFDIDIYGDGGEDFSNEHSAAHSKKGDETDLNGDAPSADAAHDDAKQPEELDVKMDEEGGPSLKQEPHDSNGGVDATLDSSNSVDPSQQMPQKQGTKRKEVEDDRPLEQGATTALFVQDLHWWTTDDEIRGWINQANCESELKDITFSEHKVNGKSKGQAFIEFLSAQAATIVKQKIESFGAGQQYTKKHAVSFTNPMTNPFRTLPKDAPTRDKNQNRDSRSHSAGPPNMANGQGSSNYNGGNGMGRGNYNNRNFGNRGGMNNMNGFNNRNFSGPMNGGFQGPMGGGFQNPMGGMQSFNNFNNRGGMMGGRGGRGRGGMNMMPNMGMNGMAMGMGNMPGQMGMGMNMGAMGMQGQGFAGPQQGHFNPGFFNQQQNQQGNQGNDWNPHGGKRPRIE